MSLVIVKNKGSIKKVIIFQSPYTRKTCSLLLSRRGILLQILIPRWVLIGDLTNHPYTFSEEKIACCFQHSIRYGAKSPFYFLAIILPSTYFIDFFILLLIHISSMLPFFIVLHPHILWNTFLSHRYCLLSDWFGLEDFFIWLKDFFNIHIVKNVILIYMLILFNFLW